MFVRDHLSLRLIRLQPGEEWAFEDRENLCFVFAKAGVGACVWSGDMQPLLPGDVSLLKSSSGGKISISGEAGMSFHCFSARFEHLFPLFAAPEISLLRTVVESLKTVKRYPASNPLALECHKLLGEVPPQFGLDHRGQLLRILAAIFSVEFKQKDLRPWGAMRPERHVTRLFEELSSAEITDGSILDLAKKFGCSTRHLNRIFHDYFGVTVAALRMELRLVRASSLLRDPDVKVIHVAEQCGFNYLNLFNSCFKRRFGMTPGQYRKICSESSAPPGQRPSFGSICPIEAVGLCPRSVLSEKASAPVERPSANTPSASANHKLRPLRVAGEVLHSGNGRHPRGAQAGARTEDPGLTVVNG